MTTFRARIREIAVNHSANVCDTLKVESAILRAIEELLEREPSLEMERSAWNAAAAHSEARGRYQQQAGVIYRAMSAQLLREVRVSDIPFAGTVPGLCIGNRSPDDVDDIPDPRAELLKQARQWIENHSDQLFDSHTDQDGEWSDDEIDASAKKLHDAYEEWIIQVDSIQEKTS